MRQWPAQMGVEEGQGGQWTPEGSPRAPQKALRNPTGSPRGVQMGPNGGPRGGKGFPKGATRRQKGSQKAHMSENANIQKTLKNLKKI